ncbi:MAG: cell wall metabolism sensor histidine kinase WalK [Phycisphaerales bacterium]|nr:cell wall metabolism sensor histidine kinase WalK [Phycisphaerales bacterium]
MTRFEPRLMIMCIGTAVTCSLGGALSIAVFGIDLRALLVVALVAAISAGGLNLMVRVRDRHVRRQLADRLDDAMRRFGDEGDAGTVTSCGKGEFNAVFDGIRLLHARLREESVARQVGTSRSEEVLSVLHSLTDPVFVFDRFGTIRLANTAAAELVPPSACPEGSDIRDVFREGPLAEQIGSDLAEGTFEARAIEFEHERPWMTTAEARVYDARTLHLGEDRAGSCLLALRDLTRERQISRMKSDFVSKASHELRTPLASIRGYLEMLVDGEAEDEEARMQFLASMLDDTERLSSLVENMLNISRIEAGIVRPRLERSDLGEISDRVAQMLLPVASEKDISISVAAAPVDLHVEGDPTMLQEVVLNLATNAIKYTPSGGRVTISVDTDPLERSVLVAVSDTGLGIPLEARERVFEKFFRVPSYERMAQGTGLGLNLCRNIVESVHRGRIGVDSTMGEGSRFWFSIPMGFAGARAA